MITVLVWAMGLERLEGLKIILIFLILINRGVKYQGIIQAGCTKL